MGRKLMKNILRPTHAFLTLFILAALTLAAIAACDTPTPTPTEHFPTESPAPSRPTATRTSGSTAQPVRPLPTKGHGSTVSPSLTVTPASPTPGPTPSWDLIGAIPGSHTTATAPTLDSSTPPMPVPTSTPPLPLKPSWLTEMLDLLPASLSQRGLWLSNHHKALDIAGLKPADSWTERASWTPEQVEEYREAREGVSSTGLHSTMLQHHSEWGETFGFGPWGVAAMAETGETNWGVFEANLLMGGFDPALVMERLEALGYQGHDHEGHRYHVLPDGVRPEVPRPIGILLRGHVGAVYVKPDMLFTAPRGEMVAEFLGVRTGEVQPLSRDPAFGDLGLALGDPLFAALLSRRSVLTPEHPLMREYEPRPDWGSLGDWEALAVGFSRPLGGKQLVSLAIWYPDLADAQGASGELARRFKTFHSPEPNPMTLLQEMCGDRWKTKARESPRGAVLTVSCERNSSQGSPGLGTGMWNILIDGTVAFLVG